MSVRRIVGFGLATLSVAVLALDLTNGFSGAGLFGFVSLGDLWARINGASLNLVQAIVQRYLFPALWDPMLVTVLLLPAWPVLGAAAAIFLMRPNNGKHGPISADGAVTNSTTHPNSLS
jgi:hypothetical protein